MVNSGSYALSTLPLTSTREAASEALSADDYSTRVLTEALARGDEAAFVEFHRLYFVRLYQLLLVICRGQEDEAREALQQTLLRVLRYARPFNSEEAFWSWLTTLARSSARDGGRKLQRYQRMLNRFTSWWHSDSDRQSARSESSTLHELLDEALGELRPEDRSLIMDKYFSGNSVREIAVTNGATEKSIEGRLVRLRRVLRDRVLEKLRTL